MGTRIPNLTLTRPQLATYVYRQARHAGLDTSTSHAIAQKVLERVLLAGETLDLVLQDEIAKHANP